MNRIEDYEFPPVDPDPDIERAFKWFKSFITEAEWNQRKADIESHLDFGLKQVRRDLDDNYFRIIGTDDTIGWYLYLVEKSLYEPHCTEADQSARILPVFQRIGMNLPLVQSIGGIQDKVTELITQSKSQSDSILFEIIVALLWARSGWNTVEFIPSVATHKEPDIKVTNGNIQWTIEAKRMTTSSEYSRAERDKWLKLWVPLLTEIQRQMIPVVLDITFHVELNQLDDDFLLDQIAGKLKFIPRSLHASQIISNELFTVTVFFVDFKRIEDHLRGNFVKYPSRQIQELVGGRWDRNSGFSMAFLGETVKLGKQNGLNNFIERIDWAAGAFWRCDAERAIESKARDIRSRLSKAVQQLSSSTPSVVHVGIETIDGEQVEFERFNRILNTVRMFDPKGKDLRWVFCHLYQSYSPPDQGWVFDETVYEFTSELNPEMPITELGTIVPQEYIEDGTHWLKDAP